MNRCLIPRKFLSAAAGMCLALSATGWSGPAAAQEASPRIPPIPPAAQRGVLQVTHPPDVLLNGQPARLSPGARIRGRNNLLTLSASLVGQELAVRYLRDTQGLVHEVWILTETESQTRP